MRVVDRLGHTARALFVPREAFAIDVGTGGSAELFSTFGVVDPDSKPDLAQSTTTYFHLVNTTEQPNTSVSTPGWQITNMGSGTSGAFISELVIANDTLLASPIVIVPLGGGASLVPRATFTYSAQSVQLPTSMGPGTYYVGTRVIPAGYDSSATDNLVSVRLTVPAPAPPPTAALHAGSTPWTATGPGALAPYVQTDSVSLQYNSSTEPCCSRYYWGYTTTAPASGAYTFDYRYTGFHSYFAVDAYLEVFVNGPNGMTVTPLKSFTCPGNCGAGFDLSGTQTVTLFAGYTWGIRANGYNFDTTRIFQGTITVVDQRAVVIP